jgi:predicted nucleic acid-binding protein
MVSFNFAAQKRAVTINDYKSLIDTMPGNFGAPAKVSITEKNNKINIQILSYDASGKLTQVVSNNLKSNLATYLSKYRMINDYIGIDVAKVIDLEFEIFVVLDATQNQGQVITQIIDQVSNSMNPKNRELGQNVNVSDLRRLIQNTAGVVSLSEIKVFNKVGGQYSSSQTSQRYIDVTTKQIELIDDTIFAEPDQIYQIRYDNKDIKVSVKNLSTVDFS